ncbi:MAG: chemotaxis protein CheW [Mariprofundaceae bacterium]
MEEETFNEPDTAKVNAPFEEGEQVELMKIMMNGEIFLLPVEDVAEVLRPVKVTPVPMAPDHMLGVANIRGQIVCIVDPGKVLHLKQKRGEQTDSSRYLILRHPRMHLGIWVDEVSELYRVAKNSLPEIDLDSHSHLRGEMNIEGHAFKLLNTQVLFD